MLKELRKRVSGRAKEDQVGVIFPRDSSEDREEFISQSHSALEHNSPAWSNSCGAWRVRGDFQEVADVLCHHRCEELWALYRPEVQDTVLSGQRGLKEESAPIIFSFFGNRLCYRGKRLK